MEIKLAILIVACAIFCSTASGFLYAMDSFNNSNNNNSRPSIDELRELRIKRFSSAVKENDNNNNNSNYAIKKFIHDHFDYAFSNCDITEAKIIAFAERHSRPEHQVNTGNLINLFSNKRAVLLIEGLEKGLTLQERGNCRLCRIVNPIMPIKGWDGSDNRQMVLKVLENIKNLVAEIRAEREGREIAHVDTTAPSPFALITKRNRSMIAAIEEEMANNDTIYVSFGKDHFFEEEAEELRAFLSKKDCCVLVPRDEERNIICPVEVQRVLSCLGKRITLCEAGIVSRDAELGQLHLSCNTEIAFSADEYRNVGIVACGTNTVTMSFGFGTIDEISIKPLLNYLNNSRVKELQFYNVSLTTSVIGLLISCAPHTLKRIFIKKKELQNDTYVTLEDLVKNAHEKKIKLEIE